MSQTFGIGPLSGSGELLARETLEGLTANYGRDHLRRRLEARFGYGSATFGDRFTGTPEIGLGLSEAGRDYSLGWRLTSAATGPRSLDLLLEAHRRESAKDAIHPTDHGVEMRLTARF